MRKTGLWLSVAWGLVACQRPLPDLDDAHRDLSEELAVFPGAEGFGTDTPAGRGGAVITVTTLDDDGPGSLREALAVAGPRTIVFEVGGTIWLTDQLVIDEPFLTIAGHSGPAPGITLAGAGFVVRTHDILIRHLRMRPGDADEGPRPAVRDGISINDEPNDDQSVFNVVVDHCSISWGIDENASTAYPGVRDVTWSNNLIAEGLYDSLHHKGDHSKGLLISDSSRRIAVLGNLFAHNDDRNPVLKEDTSALVVNNLVYDAGQFAIASYGSKRCCPIRATIENNRIVAGPETRETTPGVHLTALAHDDSRVFAAGNSIEGMDGERRSERGDHLWTDERPVTVSPLTLLDGDDVEFSVLQNAGARRADADPVDGRIRASVAERGGGFVDSPADVGGWPDQPMTRTELDLPADPAADDDGDGYTNLEQWLHRRAADLEADPLVSPP